VAGDHAYIADGPGGLLVVRMRVEEHRVFLPVIANSP
jgi:hypothetical protein